MIPCMQNSRKDKSECSESRAREQLTVLSMLHCNHFEILISE